MSIRLATSSNTFTLLSGVYESGLATSASSGLTKLYSTSGTNTDGTMTQAAIKAYVEGLFANMLTEQTGAITINVTEVTPEE